MKKNIRILNIIILLSFILIMIYCGLNTFIINDDLPYSFFMQSSERVTNIFQIIRNQLSDYLMINGRIVIHSIVQFLLIFGKNLFSIVNPVVIVISFIYMKKIIELLNLNKKINSSFVYIQLIFLFFLLKDFNYLIHWVAGSVNYIWTFALVIFFTYRYLKDGIDKNTKLNTFLIFVLSMLHEITFVYILILLLGNFINEKLIKKKNVKYYKFYLLALISGALIIFMSPGNLGRVDNMYPAWNNMTLIEKLMKTIPTVSLNFLNLNNVFNIVPIIFIITFFLRIIKSNINYKKTISLLYLMLTTLSYITSNGWLYLLLAIYIFIIIALINYKEKNNQITIIFLAFYAVVFSMIITPEFNCARPNYYMYMWMNLYIIDILYKTLKDKGIFIINILSIILVLVGVSYEINIYNYIGEVHKERLLEIEKVKNKEKNILEFKIIKYPYSMYHADANSPDSEKYWAYRYFLSYYDLEKDTKIILVVS